MRAGRTWFRPVPAGSWSDGPYHVIVLNERHLRRLLGSFVAYYNQDRTHLGVGKDSPYGRPVEQRPGVISNVVGLPRVGGLHHRYAWREAA